MDHIAIMNKSWDLISKILKKEKTIESRWYKYRFSPWNNISKGDFVYFKNSGEPVTAKAEVDKILQFEDLDEGVVNDIVNKYGKSICLQNTNYKEWANNKKYCILIFLKNPQEVKPFNIDKTGFGNACAWMSVGDVNKIRL